MSEKRRARAACFMGFQSTVTHAAGRWPRAPMPLVRRATGGDAAAPPFGEPIRRRSRSLPVVWVGAWVCLIAGAVATIVFARALGLRGRIGWLLCVSLFISIPALVAGAS